MLKPTAIKVLQSEISDELRTIEQISQEASQGLAIPEGESPNRIELRGWALLAHDFYTGIESIFERIAVDINGQYPNGPDSHQRLIRNMTLEIEGVRPSVISKESAVELDELRKFRHFIRHAYGASLEWRRIREHLVRIQSFYSLFQRQIQQFLDFLESLSNSL